MDKAKRRKRLIVLAIVMAILGYIAAYCYQYYDLNNQPTESHLVYKLPPVLQSGIEIYDKNDKENRVFVFPADLDRDGIKDWIMDGGDYGRGGSCDWYYIYRHRRDGTFEAIGSFYCNEYIILPSFTLFGNASILCFLYDKVEWIHLKNGRYEGKHPNC